ncbi:MAG: hypothetical protein MUE82_12700, partial [Chloroflexi bacterium]|nr:hypothetical protein [Chloroflexota bacterium]
MGSPQDGERPGCAAAGAVTGARPSVAILVDDLATWVVGGLQPTGIQRVVSELLDTALERPDIRAWPAVSVFGTAGSGRPRLAEVARAALTWGPRTDEPGTRLRLLRSA